MPFPLAGMIGGMLATRTGHSLATTFGSTFLRSPIIQGGQFGVGYTGGSYLGYGGSNTWDPLGLHKPKYKYTSSNVVNMPYGRSYGYRRRSYYGRRRYSYGRRRSYYRRRYY